MKVNRLDHVNVQTTKLAETVRFYFRAPNRSQLQSLMGYLTITFAPTSARL